MMFKVGAVVISTRICEWIPACSQGKVTGVEAGMYVV